MHARRWGVRKGKETACGQRATLDAKVDGGDASLLLYAARVKVVGVITS